MKLTKELMAFCLVFVVVFSFAGLLQKQKDATAAFTATVFDASIGKGSLTKASYELLTFRSAHLGVLTYPEAFNLGSALAEKTPLPENTTRTEIFNFITNNPGVQFRAICSGLGLSIGVVQFHLLQLQKAGLIISVRKGRYRRLFAAGKFSRQEIEAIATLKLNTVRNILKTLLERKPVTHHDLAAKLSISSQALTWQINRLRDENIVQQSKNGLTVTYSIKKTRIYLITKGITLLEKK